MWLCGAFKTFLGSFEYQPDKHNTATTVLGSTTLDFGVGLSVWLTKTDRESIQEI